MSKKVELLSKGLFEKSFMDSKVKTRAVSKKEWILGHLIGPLGLIFVVNTIAALVEKFFTQQTCQSEIIRQRLRNWGYGTYRLCVTC